MFFFLHCGQVSVVRVVGSWVVEYEKKKKKVFRSARNRGGEKWWGCWTVLSTLQPRHKQGLKAIQLAEDYRVCVWKEKGFFFSRWVHFYFCSTNFCRRISPQIRELTCVRASILFLCIPTRQKTFHDVWTTFCGDTARSLDAGAFKIDAPLLGWCVSVLVQTACCILLCEMWSVSLATRALF